MLAAALHGIKSEWQRATYHQRAKVCSEIQGVIGAPFVKEHDIRDDLGL